MYFPAPDERVKERSCKIRSLGVVWYALCGPVVLVSACFAVQWSTLIRVARRAIHFGLVRGMVMSYGMVTDIIGRCWHFSLRSDPIVCYAVVESEYAVVIICKRVRPLRVVRRSAPIYITT